MQKLVKFVSIHPLIKFRNTRSNINIGTKGEQEGGENRRRHRRIEYWMVGGGRRGEEIRHYSPFHRSGKGKGGAA